MQHYVDYDLQGEEPDLRPRTAADAVARDTEDIWGGGIASGALADPDRDVIMIRAERGLQDEPVPLYPEPYVDLLLAKYPRLTVVTVPETNHYDVVIGAYGAEQVAKELDRFFG
jgi:hypothetical protein